MQAERVAAQAPEQGLAWWFQEQQRSLDLGGSQLFGLQMDELQGSVRQLQAFMDESTQCLQKVSVQLEKKSMQQLDSSPARKLLKLHLQSPPTTRGSRPRQ